MSTDKLAISLNPPELQGVTADTLSLPIFTHGTKSIEFSIVTDASADFDIRPVSSIQEEPADPSVAASATNDYQYPDYQDETNGQATHNSIAPSNIYNPGGAKQAVFRVNTGGARWVWIQVLNYVAGTLLVCNISLSDNE